jgi:hypothetical protein
MTISVQQDPSSQQSVYGGSTAALLIQAVIKIIATIHYISGSSIWSTVSYPVSLAHDPKSESLETCFEVIVFGTND